MGIGKECSSLARKWGHQGMADDGENGFGLVFPCLRLMLSFLRRPAVYIYIYIYIAHLHSPTNEPPPERTTAFSSSAQSILLLLLLLMRSDAHRIFFIKITNTPTPAHNLFNQKPFPPLTFLCFLGEVTFKSEMPIIVPTQRKKNTGLL